jgi:hypothetical protein
MPLPDNYNPWLFLHEQLLTTYNLDVESTFVGVPIDDLTNPLSALRTACLLQVDDTVDMTLLRFMLFYFTLKGHLPTPVYGIPVQEFQSNATFRPQVKLFFMEDYSSTLVAEKLPRATAEITFRLMNWNSQTINPSEARTLASSIKTLFGTGQGFVWEKGTVKVTYADPIHGYDFRLLAISESEAVRVINKVLEIQGHSFNESKVTVHQSRSNFPVIPPTIEVYGKSVKGKRRRPITNVRFRYAELLVDGMPNSVSLVDLTGKRTPLAK